MHKNKVIIIIIIITPLVVISQQKEDLYILCLYTSAHVNMFQRLQVQSITLAKSSCRIWGRKLWFNFHTDEMLVAFSSSPCLKLMDADGKMSTNLNKHLKQRASGEYSYHSLTCMNRKTDNPFHFEMHLSLFWSLENSKLYFGGSTDWTPNRMTDCWPSMWHSWFGTFSSK